MNTEHLVMCVLNQTKVEILMGSIVDYYGKILGVTDETIKVEGGYYLREHCIVRFKKRK
ncbi:hypothetical protein PAECIP111802_07046 [Paenibacillus allorhizosphaerae]|uniref:DUF2642 domain-containing protein n=1 Tax=Paenibacillus allorhizosphaerae TaxID=2849866 RepID=A0ABM8VU69_9BACL|nr:hypothetical protein PAECIP111802_07046 [Paenibacillus allorhizosphaerae]